MESVKNSGGFSEISSPRLLVHLHLTNFSGTLRISQGALLKLLYFRGGAIAMASSNDQGDHLAPILMRAGKLKPEQLELARKQTQPGTSLARVLVQMGFLTSGELFAGARQQLRQIVAGVLGVTDGRYEIQSDYFPREITSLNVDTRELLLDLLAELPERSFVLLEVGAPDTVYAPALPSPSSGNRGASLPSVWQQHSERFSGPMSIRAFGQLAGLDDFAASKTVYALYLFGILEPRPAESAEIPAPPELPVSGAPIITLEEEVVPPAVAADRPPWSESRDSVPPSGPPGGTDHDVLSTEAQPEAISPPGPAVAPGDPPAEQPAPPAIPAGPATLPENRTGDLEIEARGQPIRLEFKGALSEPVHRGRSSGPWGILSIFAGCAILVAAFGWFVFLKDSGAPGDVSPAALGNGRAPTAAGPVESASPAATPESAEGVTGPPGQRAEEEDGKEGRNEQGPATAGPSGTLDAGISPAAGAGPPPSSTAQPRDSRKAEDQAAASGSAGESSPPQGSKPPGEKSAGSPPPKPPSPPVSGGKLIAGIPPFAAADLFFEGRKLLDGGDPAAAASAWSRMVRQETRNLFTLQLAIACQEQSVRKAARHTSGSVQFFTTPFSLQGRACYRLCWGSYPTLEEARAAKASVPAFFQGEGGSPVVVSLGKLVPAENP